MTAKAQSAPTAIHEVTAGEPPAPPTHVTAAELARLQKVTGRVQQAETTVQRAQEALQRATTEAIACRGAYNLVAEELNEAYGALSEIDLESGAITRGEAAQ